MSRGQKARWAFSSDNSSVSPRSIAIVGAAVFWYLRDRGRSPRYLIYAVFVLSLVSIYSGIKLGYSASITLATPELIHTDSIDALPSTLSSTAYV